MLNSTEQGKAPTPVEMNQLVELFNAGHHVELESRARLLIERYPESGFAWKVLGASLQMQGKEGLPALQKATELLPGDTEAHSNLGVAFQAVGQLDDAVASYRRGLEIEPDDAEGHNNLGGALKALGQLDNAVASYRRALEIKADYVEAHYNLGIALQELGQHADAAASYRRALEIEPDSVEAHNNLGNALQALGQLDGAVASYRRALEIKPDFGVAYGNLGEVLRIQGKLDEALGCYQHQVRLMPGNGAAQHMIASLTGNNTERAPIQYVENVFDSYAYKFDAHLLQVLKYEAPEQLVALVTQHSIPSAEKWNVLDLGCGTGMVGLAIAPYARQLVGVDLSAKMLEKARARNVYQRLEHLDLLKMMQGEKASSYDVIIAADVFIYLGKLDEVISEIKRLLCPGGVFAFSIEALGVLSDEEASQGVQQEYKLESTGRYTHSNNYITRLAFDNGFLPKEMAAAQIRMEDNKPVNGYLVLWKS
jgi:predicted TPR repeat methyltransferase